MDSTNDFDFVEDTFVEPKTEIMPDWEIHILNLRGSKDMDFKILELWSK